MLEDEEIEVLNFIQDFGCARIDQLKNLFSHNINYKNILNSNMVRKKGDIYVHNTKTIDEKMLIALDILCKFKNRCKTYKTSYFPVNIKFLNTNNDLYYIIVADKENKKGIIKLINANTEKLNSVDKLILAFPDVTDLYNIDCDIPFLYCTYPGLKIINN